LIVEVDAAMSKALDGKPYAFAPTPVGQRSLRNLLVSFQARTGDAAVVAHLQRATSMTDTQAALGLLANTTGKARDDAFAAFYARWKGEALMIDKWFALQAMTTRKSALDDIATLAKHEAFSLENPNRARSIIVSLGMSNPLHFHDASGRGYTFLADQVRTLDAFNPQIAARLMTPLTRWKRQNPARQALMQAELRKILARDGVSKDVFEITTKALADAPV